jgi:hypothetical protein
MRGVMDDPLTNGKFAYVGNRPMTTSKARHSPETLPTTRPNRTRTAAQSAR